MWALMGRAAVSLALVTEAGHRAAPDVGLQGECRGLWNVCWLQKQPLGVTEAGEPQTGDGEAWGPAGQALLHGRLGPRPGESLSSPVG